MKIKEIIIIVVICLIITIGIIVIPNINKKEELNQYEITDADVSCYYESEATSDDTYIANIHNYMYLYEDNELLSKVIYVRVYDNSYYNESLSYILNDLKDLYKTIDGVVITEEVVNKKTILKIEYDYSKIDIDYIKKNYTDIFDESFPLMNVTNKTTIKEYISLEDQSYTCS